MGMGDECRALRDAHGKKIRPHKPANETAAWQGKSRNRRRMRMRQWPSSPHAGLGTCAYSQPAELPLRIALSHYADWPSVKTLALTQTLLVFQLLLVLLECISLSLPTAIGMGKEVLSKPSRPTRLRYYKGSYFDLAMIPLLRATGLSDALKQIYSSTINWSTCYKKTINTRAFVIVKNQNK